MQLSTAYVSTPRVLVAGQPQPGLSANVISVLVEETVEGLYRCEARFYNFGLEGNSGRYLYFGRDIIDFGTDFAVHMGQDNQVPRVFNGRISAIEAEYPFGGSGLITLLAEDRLQGLRMTRRTRTFEEMSDADIMQQIAAEHSLEPQVSLPGSPVHKVLAQVNQSDLAFIRERARILNAELWVEDRNLFVKKRTDRIGREINLAYEDNLISFTVRADLAHQCTEVGVAGWNVAAKDAIEVEATASAIESELSGNERSGSSILQQAFGDRRERIVHTVPLTDEEARGIAEARYCERARRFVTGTGVADGDARIRVGSVVKLEGLGNLFNGNYYVTRVRHSYDGTYGFRTTFDVERPGIGQP
jgi:phage protein D